MNISTKVIKYINEYGFKNGTKIYMANKYKRNAILKFPFLKHKIHLRSLASNSDLVMFWQIFQHKEYEINIPFDPKVILDLGANVGLASVYFSNRFPTAEIFSLEPNTDNYQMALKNVEFYPNVTMVQAAIWNSLEEIQLIDKGYGEASFMVEPGTGSKSVQAFTVDSFLQQMNVKSADIVKIDIEGAEKEIFEKGYENWLPNTKIIIVETHDRYKRDSSKAVLNTITKYDFSLEISGENLVFYNNMLTNPFC